MGRERERERGDREVGMLHASVSWQLCASSLISGSWWWCRVEQQGVEGHGGVHKSRCRGGGCTGLEVGGCGGHRGVHGAGGRVEALQSTG